VTSSSLKNSKLVLHDNVIAIYEKLQITFAEFKVENKIYFEGLQIPKLLYISASNINIHNKIKHHLPCEMWCKKITFKLTGLIGRIIAQAVSCWLPTAAVWGSSPGLVMWDLWWTKWRWGWFSPSTSVSPANLHSTNCSTITLIYHLGFVQ
jgi:hypothetical protein